MSTSKIYGSVAEFEPAFFVSEGKRWFALATGCFDNLHPGHVELLIQANRQVNFNKAFRYPLVVGINCDESIKRLKGPKRPIFDEKDRAFMLASLECVHSVFVFKEDTVVETLKALRPAIWVKGGDRALETLNQEERAAANEIGTEIVILVHERKVTTGDILRKLEQ